MAYGGDTNPVIDRIMEEEYAAAQNEYYNAWHDDTANAVEAGNIEPEYWDMYWGYVEDDKKRLELEAKREEEEERRWEEERQKEEEERLSNMRRRDDANEAIQ